MGKENEEEKKKRKRGEGVVVQGVEGKGNGETDRRQRGETL